MGERTDGPAVTGRGAVLSVAALMAVTGCTVRAGDPLPSAGATSSAVAASTTSTPRPDSAVRRLPPAGARFSYQLGGAYAPPSQVSVVERDRTDRPAAGAYSICYVNGFQTQPDAIGWWRRTHPDLLLHDATGHEIEDTEWGELLLAADTPAHRAALVNVVGAWIDGCARSGYAAVELDNLDSVDRSHGRLRWSDALAYARALVQRAHRAGLAVAQKNAAEQVSAGRRAGFDFAVAESCAVYAECPAYVEGYGRHVIEIEYDDAAFAAACRAQRGRISITRRDRDLTPPGAKGHVERWC